MALKGNRVNIYETIVSALTRHKLFWSLWNDKGDNPVWCYFRDDHKIWSHV